MQSRLIRVFKPDMTATFVFRAMIIVAIIFTLFGFLILKPMLACAGLFVVALFTWLAFNQPGQSIELYNDKVLFKTSAPQPWMLPLANFSRLELITTQRNATRFSPGRTILLRFVENDDKFCAELNINAFDKDAIRSLIESIVQQKEGVSLNPRAKALLSRRRYKEITMGQSSKAE